MSRTLTPKQRRRADDEVRIPFWIATLAEIRETIDAIPWSHGSGDVHPGRPNPNPLPPTPRAKPRAKPRPWRTREEWLAWRKERDAELAASLAAAAKEAAPAVARRPIPNVQKPMSMRVDTLLSIYAFARPNIRAAMLVKAKGWILRGELSTEDATRLVAGLERLTPGGDV